MISVRTLRSRFHDVFDVVDRIRNTSVFSYALICEVNLTVSVYCYVFQQSVTFNCVVDIWFRFFIQVDNLSVATTFVVEYTFVIPSFTASSILGCSSSMIS